MLIKAEGLTKSYGNVQVLKGVSLSIDTSEIVSITGASGAGKTTLLQLLGTLDKPDSGTISIASTDLSQLSGNKLSDFRNRQIGFVFQFHNLLPEFTALENICLPGLISGNNLKNVSARAQELLGFLNLEHRSDHKPSELSGGEQQRVAVARALINNPPLVLADEPSGNLDSENARELHRIFFSLRDKYHQTFVIVTHNEELASMADRKIQLKDGSVLKDA